MYEHFNSQSHAQQVTLTVSSDNITPASNSRRERISKNTATFSSSNLYNTIDELHTSSYISPHKPEELTNPAQFTLNPAQLSGDSLLELDIAALYN